MTADSVLAPTPAGLLRSRAYQIYIVAFMSMVALMDNYLSGVENTAIPYILAEFQIEAADFAALKARFLIITFFVFALNALNDLYGRKPGTLVLILLLGLSSLAIVLITPTLILFMIFYAIAMFATVSNMWAIVVGEESPASKRARYTAAVFVISLIPVQAFLPVILVERLGLNWRWMYGIMFIVMIPVLLLWFFMQETGRYKEISAERTQRRTWRDLFGLGVVDRSDLRYMALASSIATGVIVAVMLVFWAGYFFMNLRGFSLSQWSTVLFALLSLEIVGGLSGGWFMDRVGRNRMFVIGGIGMALALASLGYLPVQILPIVYAIIGFFLGVISTWLYVYIPEIFPTERRGTCVGWVMSIARLAYVIGPALAALLLRVYPTMEGFWIAAGLVMLIPTAIILITRPFETRALELEEIAVQR